jgi:transitional endoplasmic reticulum ATPase
VADTARILVVASTSRTDAVDSALVAPGRLDHLVEVPLPDADEQRDILQLLTARTEGDAGRKLFDSIDYRKLLPLMGGMSGADLTEIIRRALETKVRQVAEGGTATNVVTEDLLDAVDRYKRVRSVVEKIRYGQYL